MFSNGFYLRRLPNFVANIRCFNTLKFNTPNDFVQQFKYNSKRSARNFVAALATEMYAEVEIAGHDYEQSIKVNYNVHKILILRHYNKTVAHHYRYLLQYHSLDKGNGTLPFSKSLPLVFM